MEHLTTEQFEPIKAQLKKRFDLTEELFADAHRLISEVQPDKSYWALEYNNDDEGYKLYTCNAEQNPEVHFEVLDCNRYIKLIYGEELTIANY